MIPTETLWSLLSLTSINTIVTCVSILISIWAALAATIAACSIRSTYKKVKTAEFVVYVSKHEEVCLNLIKDVVRYEQCPFEWNRDNAKNDKINELAGVITKLNKYYPIMSKNERESLQSAAQAVMDMIGTMNEFATGDDLEKFRDKLNKFDRQLQTTISEYQIYLFGD